MPRTSRAVALGYPHHITQRGNNRNKVFFDDADHVAYLDALTHYSQEYQLDIWAYCLMPNHIHILAVPHAPEGLARGIGMTHLRYSRYFSRRHFRSGHIWQNRFHSCIVDTDAYLWAVVRYIENNPVKAGLTKTALDYRWSSCHYHLGEKDDAILKSSTWLDRDARNDYRRFLSEEDERMTKIISQATTSGRALCGADTLTKLGKELGRSL